MDSMTIAPPSFSNRERTISISKQAFSQPFMVSAISPTIQRSMAVSTFWHLAAHSVHFGAGLKISPSTPRYTTTPLFSPLLKLVGYVECITRYQEHSSRITKFPRSSPQKSPTNNILMTGITGTVRHHSKRERWRRGFHRRYNR